MKNILAVSVLISGLASYSVAAQEATPNTGRNVLSVSPVQMSERTPTGIGMQYERFIGSNDRISLCLPLAYSFGHSDPCDPTIRARVFYAYPGVKFYPFGTQHMISYAVGPSLAFGKGTTNCDCTEPVQNIGDEKPKTCKPVTEMGALINNSISLQATAHVYVSGEIGIGATYLNKENGQDLGTDLMLQLNVRVGYRF